MKEEIKLKDKKTGDILNLDTPICFVANGYAWEFDSVKELTNACGDMEENEEPETFWYISPTGTPIKSTTSIYDPLEIHLMKRIGNYFEREEDAEKAVEKLRAWKRLKDKGLHVTTFYVEDGSLVIRAKTHNSSGAENWEDLDLLFSQEKGITEEKTFNADEDIDWRFGDDDDMPTNAEINDLTDMGYGG